MNSSVDVKNPSPMRPTGRQHRRIEAGRRWSYAEKLSPHNKLDLMKPLFVSKVERYSPGDDAAKVTLRSESGELVAFNFPCDVEVGATVPNKLYVLDGEVHAAYLRDWPEDLRYERSAERLERTGVFSYRGVGRVVDQPAGLVETLGFVLDFGEVPCEGHVEFECVRVDL
jgi:hypothetical protein